MGRVSFAKGTKNEPPALRTADYSRSARSRTQPNPQVPLATKRLTFRKPVSRKSPSSKKKLSMTGATAPPPTRVSFTRLSIVPLLEAGGTPAHCFAVCVDVRKQTPSGLLADAAAMSFTNTMNIFIKSGVRRGIFVDGSYLIAGANCEVADFSVPQTTPIVPQSTARAPQAPTPVVSPLAKPPPVTLTPLAIPPHANPAAESFRFYSSQLTKVSKVILQTAQQGGSRALAATNVVMYVPRANLEAKGDESNAGKWLASFVGLCCRTLKSPRIATITVAVVLPLTPPSSSPPPPSLVGELSAAIAAADAPGLGIGLLDDAISLSQHLRQLTLPNLTKLTCKFQLPSTTNDDSCSISLDLVPTVLPLLPGASLDQFLEPSSLSEMSVVQMVSATSVDVSLLHGLPLRGKPSLSSLTASLEEHRSNSLLLGQLCACLKEKQACLVLRTKIPNPMTKLHDTYVLVPEDANRKSVVLLLVATRDTLLLGDEDKMEPRQDEGGEEEEKMYKQFIEQSLDAFNITTINPNELGSSHYDEEEVEPRMGGEPEVLMRAFEACERGEDTGGKEKNDDFDSDHDSGTGFVY